MTTKAIADWLETAIATALTVTVYKGFPDWGRDSVTAPCAALLFASDDAAQATLGGGRRAISTAFDVWTYATSEIQLWNHVDLLQAYWLANATPTISSQRTKLRPEPIERQRTDNAPQQASYACMQRISIEHP